MLQQKAFHLSWNLYSSCTAKKKKKASNGKGWREEIRFRATQRLQVRIGANQAPEHFDHHTHPHPLIPESLIRFSCCRDKLARLQHVSWHDEHAHVFTSQTYFISTRPSEVMSLGCGNQSLLHNPVWVCRDKWTLYSFSLFWQHLCVCVCFLPVMGSHEVPGFLCAILWRENTQSKAEVNTIKDQLKPPTFKWKMML